MSCRKKGAAAAARGSWRRRDAHDIASTGCGMQCYQSSVILLRTVNHCLLHVTCCMCLRSYCRPRNTTSLVKLKGGISFYCYRFEQSESCRPSFRALSIKWTGLRAIAELPARLAVLMAKILVLSTTTVCCCRS
jgi:hypothetical protein